jgi:UDP-N-acetylmuramate dehydrogenase
MKIEENVSLKPLHTFKVEAKAKLFATFSSVNDVKELCRIAVEQFQPLLILGGGSNILFTKDFNGLVLKNEYKGIEVINENEEYVDVKVYGGESWHGFVLYCLAHNYAGIENLSLIPGTVGAAPIQNIGAYGVELKDVFLQLEAWHIHEKSVVTFLLNDCSFGYRESVFKKKYKNEFIILSLTVRLQKHPVFHIEYGTIQQELEKMNVQQLSIQAIAQAVMNIRQSKLPNPEEIGNAGSFFKNPEVDSDFYNSLKQKYTSMPGFATATHHIKIPAAWLIEQCNWKGYREGDAGCYIKQPLILVNYGNATGRQIFELSEKIIDSVYQKFQIVLEREVNIF